MRQRILFIILIIVVVLVGWTILRPKPRAKTKVLTAERTKVPTKPSPPPPVAVTKTEIKPEPIQPTSKTDTAKAKMTTPAPKPIEPIPVTTKLDTGKIVMAKKPDTLKPKEIKPTIQPPPESALGKKVTVQQEEVKVVKWGSDPFIRDWVLATEIRDLKLKAVTISGAKAYALINDQILERGEAILGKRIIGIERDKVILEQGGRQFILFLGE